ncbi:hypothetical protein ALC62_15717 [Cyphomyrmex costatus]|uniref:Envelope fusion protein n=1 Tax=Cyphomyrmex costatus TaxID=456900 RepID=A0A151I6E9_9HYME|nr:hypothetical protein ALC62_15717 [Cyphomyrmex costatus]
MKNKFFQVIEKLEDALLEHEIDLNILIDGILFRKQGLIHPRIVTPIQILNNSRIIKEQIPHAEFPITLNLNNIDELIKISNLKVIYSNQRLIYILHIPLLNAERYTLYKPIPLPARQTFDETKFATITSETDFIAISEDTDTFYEFQNDELQRCSNYERDYICPTIFPQHKIRHTKNCHVEIIINRRIFRIL